MSPEKKPLPAGSDVTIYAPADLSKRWFVAYKDSDGRRVKVYADINRGQTAEARMERAQAVADALRNGVGAGRGGHSASLKQRAAEWLNSQPMRPKSISTYRSVLDGFFQAVGERPKTEQVEAFFDGLRLRASSATYNKYRQKLGQVLKALGHGSLLANVPTVKEHSEPARYFQRYQVKRLGAVMAERDPELWLFVRFMYYCFIRPRELRAMRVAHLLLDDGRIYVPGSISKNGKSEYVAIPDAFLPVLEDYYATASPNEYLFPRASDATKPVAENDMYNRHRAILKELDFPQGYTLYSWKHTGAIQAVKAGVGVKALQIQLRHHSLDQVNDYLRQMGVFDLDGLKRDFPEI